MPTDNRLWPNNSHCIENGRQPVQPYEDETIAPCEGRALGCAPTQHVQLLAKDDYLRLEGNSRPEQVEEHPLDQVEELKHTVFIVRFGPSGQADGICGRHSLSADQLIEALRACRLTLRGVAADSWVGAPGARGCRMVFAAIDALAHLIAGRPHLFAEQDVGTRRNHTAEEIGAPATDRLLDALGECRGAAIKMLTLVKVQGVSLGSNSPDLATARIRLGERPHRKHIQQRSGTTEMKPLRPTNPKEPQSVDRHVAAASVRNEVSWG
jgi:hypothetical protein